MLNGVRSTPCRAQDPKQCRYHAVERELMKLETQMFQSGSVSRELLETWRETKNLYERFGVDPDVWERNGELVKLGSPSKQLQSLVNSVHGEVLSTVLFHSLNPSEWDTRTVKGVQTELLLKAAAERAGIKVSHVEGSHAQGADLSVGVNPSVSVSVKSGSFKARTPDLVSLSSFRSTRQVGLDEKLEHMKSQEADLYFALPSFTGKNGVVYQSLWFPRSVVDGLYERDRWVEVGSDFVYRPVAGDVVHDACISHKMSGQLWWTLDLGSPQFSGFRSVIHTKR